MNNLQLENIVQTSASLKKESDNVYEVAITCIIDDIETTLFFDYVQEVSTTLSTTITTHPLVTGDIIADHQYINPSTMEFSGTFSLYGNKKNYTILQNDKYISNKYGNEDTSRLSYIEELFERIQKEGIYCTVCKMSINRDTSRFKVRNNMVLNSITWTEREFSVDFDFSFVEVLNADVPMLDDYVEEDDPDLPILRELVQSSASENLLDKGGVLQQVIFVLQNENLMDEHFLNGIDWLKFVAGMDITIMGVSVVVGAGALAVIVGLVGVGSVFPVGTAIAAAIGLAAGAVAGIISLINFIKRGFKYKIGKFKDYRKESKRNQEGERFIAFVQQIYDSLSVLDEGITLLTFDIDVPQQNILTIDNELYCFTFSKATENSMYSLTISKLTENGDETTLKPISNVLESSISSLFECNEKTPIITTNTGTQIYLANLTGSQQIIEENEQGQVSTPKYEENDLRNFGIIISSVDMGKFNDLIYNLIKNSILIED